MYAIVEMCVYGWFPEFRHVFYILEMIAVGKDDYMLLSRDLASTMTLSTGITCTY